MVQKILYQEAALPQRLFVHINKDFFVAGEDLWLSVYMHSGTNQPFALEKLVMVEVLNGGGEAVLQTQLLLQDGKADGTLTLPTTIVTGRHYLRVYTHAAKNESGAAFYETQITIVNATQRPAWAALDGGNKLQLRLAPEGGRLVYGMQNTTAVWCANEYGEGVAANGFILNQANDTIGRFTTDNKGKTSVGWTPVAGNTYKAVVKSGEQFATLFPIQVAADGLGMQVKRVDDKRLQVQVSATPSWEGQIAFVSFSSTAGVTLLQQQLINGRAVFVLPVTEIIEGLSEIKLYDAKGKKQGAQGWYQPPAMAQHINIQINKAQFTLREGVAANINLLPHTAAWANLSASVFLIDSLQKVPEADNTLLSSIGNDIPHLWPQMQPTTLLQDDTNSTNQISFNAPQYEGPLVAARITNSQTGAPAPGITVYLSLPGEDFQLATAVSDSLGLAYFNIKTFVGNREAIVQLRKEEQRMYKVQLLSPFARRPVAPFSAIRLPEAWAAQLEQHALAAQVQTAFNNNNAVFEKKFFTDTLPFYGVPDKTYLLDDYTRFATLEEVMREYVTEVAVRRHDNLQRYQVYNRPYNQLFENDPLLLIDGVPFFDMAQVAGIDPAKLKKLDIVSRRYARGTEAYDGIISFVTYDGKVGGMALQPAAVAAIAGAAAHRKFIAPDYAVQHSRRVPDQRIQLFWEPHLQLSKAGTAQLSFFTSDVPGRYAIVVRGITKKGQESTAIAYFNVVKE